MRTLPHNLGTPLRSSGRGFTLIEVVITMGLIATALLPLIALMALATDSQREANEESIAMMISQSIFADLRKSSEKMGVLVRKSSNYPEIPGASPDADYDQIPTGSNYYVVYGMDPDWASFGGASGTNVDRGAKPLRKSSLGEFNSGTGSGDATNDVLSTHMVEIQITPEVESGPSQGGVYEPGLSRVSVSVEVPAVAPAGERRKYVFSSYLTLTDRF